MITLYLFQQAWDLLDLNPYALKVATFLRFHDIEHTLCYHPLNQPPQKIPYLVDNNQTITDSSVIIKYLKENYALSTDDHLTKKQISLTLLIQRVLEEDLYAIILYSRMKDPNGLTVFKRDIFSQSEDYTQAKVNTIENNVTQYIKGRGLGNLSATEIYQRGINNLDAISNHFSNTHYFFGEHPHAIDAIVYAFLENIRQVPIDTPLNTYISSNNTMNAYCENISNQFFK